MVGSISGDCTGFRVRSSGFSVLVLGSWFWFAFEREPRTPNPILEEASVEWQRQQVFEVELTFGFLEVGELDLEVAAELPEDLPAGAARRRPRLGVGHDRQPREDAVPLRQRLENGDPFRADRQTLSCLLA